MSSSTSFLSQLRKGSSSKSSRVIKQLQQEIGKLQAQNTVIEDEGLLDVGATVKGRLVVEHGGDKLTYTRKIIAIPTHKVPIEPDGQFLTFWVKANHTGLNLIDSSKFDNIIDVNNNRHFCLEDSGGLDLGYIGKKDGVNSSTAWSLNGTDSSAQAHDNVRLQVKGTVTGFSITAWVKITDFSLHNSVERRIVAKTDNLTNAYALFVTPTPTQKAVFAVKFNDIEYKVETPATLTTNTWYFIAATFKSSATQEAKIYLNGTVSTTAYTPMVTYPDMNSFPITNLQLFTNGRKQLIDPLFTDTPPPHVFDVGDFSGMVRDVRIWREKILTQQEITNFNTNKVTISNVALGQSHIAGFVWVPSDTGLSSFTTTSFSDTSFTI